MSTNRYLAAAPVVSQVDTFTPSNINTGDIFYVKLTGFDNSSSTVSFTVAGTETAAAVVTGLAAAIAADTSGLFTGITTSGTDTLILTGTAGTAFQSSAPTPYNGGGGSAPAMGLANTTKNEGPEDWSSVANWSLGALPGNSAGENVFIANSNVELKYGLNQSAISNALASLHIEQSYTGKIGHNGSTGIVGEYLQIKATTLYIGENFYGGNPSGSNRICIDLGSVTASTITIYNSGSQPDANKPAIRLLFDNSSTVIRDIRKGTVGVGFEAGETGELDSALISYDKPNTRKTDASLTIGAGITIDSINQLGGSVTLLTAATTVTSKAGTLLTALSGAITTLNCNGGEVTAASTGTIGTCNVTAGSCDFNQSADPRTVSNLVCGPAGEVEIDTSVITLTNDIVLAAGLGRIKMQFSAA